MRRHPADAVIRSVLRDLDPAPEARATDAERKHAAAAFARIVASPVDEVLPRGRDAVRRRRRRLLVPASAAAGVAAVAGLLLAGSWPGGGTAYGSWTPVPVALTHANAGEAAATCRTALRVPDGGERVALAERRGGWTYVLLAGAATEAVCLMPDDLVGQAAAGPGDVFGSYDTDVVAPAPLDADQITETTSMQGSTDEGYFLWVEGYVGGAVTGVTVHTSSGHDIQASVAGQRFAAWWPSMQQSSVHRDETWSYTVHLADGSSRHVG